MAEVAPNGEQATVRIRPQDEAECDDGICSKACDTLGCWMERAHAANEKAAAQQRLTIVPITLRAANAFVGQEHRHHPPSRGHKFSIGVQDEAGELRGVAIAGRPVARQLDDGLTLEVLRVATDGTDNACSALYGAVARIGTAMGYRRDRILTYTLASEPGTSLRAAGWYPAHVTKSEDWDRPSRGRNAEHHPTEAKTRWHAAPSHNASYSSDSSPS